MSKTIRNRKQGKQQFSNSWTNRNRRQNPKTTWDELKVFHADGSGNYWLTNVPKYERKQSHKENRKQAKQALDCKQTSDTLDWDNFQTKKKYRY